MPTKPYYSLFLFFILTSPLFAFNLIPVSTCAELMDIKNNLSGDYVLANSIDCSGKNFIPIGTVDKPFTGHFNGASHTITHLSISNGHPAAGLFGYTRSAEIKNLYLEKVNIEITDDTQALGALVGVAEWTKIQAVKVYGMISGNQNSLYVGGLVGLLKNDSRIYGSSANVDINALNPRGYVGGLVGQQIISSIRGSFATGSVSGYSNVGGLTGNLKGGDIGGSYATNTVISQYDNAHSIGGLVGTIDPSPNSKTQGAEISQTYATGNVEGNLSSGNMVGGLIGRINTGYGPTITDSFATGHVTANRYVGG
ncbi:MAG TPA: GLUG motif-containing protein, partial [Gammaproteobacteria bacterium]|nr:GLUG motif-containing protein [Gammaproteobacteria bacterium]